MKTAQDNDVGSSEYWNDFKEISQEKRARNRESSADYLKTNGIAFVSKNSGAHLIVTNGSGLIDFWPGTGKWNSRCGKKGRGVMALERFIVHGR